MAGASAHVDISGGAEFDRGRQIEDRDELEVGRHSDGRDTSRRGAGWVSGRVLGDVGRRVAGRRRENGQGDSGDPGVDDEPEVLDARLLPAAVCCWGATLVALTAGWVAGVLLAAALVLVAIGLWVLLLWGMAHRGERRRAVAVVALAAVLLAAGFAVAAAWREHRVATHPLRNAAGMSVRVVVTPSGDPKAVRGKSFGGSRWVVRGSLDEYRLGETTVRAGGSVVVLASGDAWAELVPGQAVEFPARVDLPGRRDLTVVMLLAHGPPRPVGGLPWWQRVAHSVRTDFATAASRALPAEPAGLLPALVDGDTSALPDELREEFEIAGLEHLCVVSGANFTILLAAVLLAVRVLTLGPRAGALIAAAALVMFVIIARPDPSVLRAGAMGAITLLALVTGRRKQALPALCAAIIGLLAVWPALAVSVGFALSVGATAGLILLAPSWADWLRARGWRRVPAEIVAVAAGAFVVTTPLMVALDGKVNLVAIVANVLVEPVIAPITVIGAVGAVLACVWLPPAVLVVRCAAPPMWWLLFVAEHVADVPGSSVEVPGGPLGGVIACVVVAVGILVLRFAVLRRVVLTVAFGVAAVVIPVRIWHPGWPPAGWVLAACDVGQGDGFVLSVGAGTAVVIDVGPEARPMRNCLDRLRISRIALLVLTHPHADHIGGISGAVDGRAVAAVAVGPHELEGLAPNAGNTAVAEGMQPAAQSGSGSTGGRAHETGSGSGCEFVHGSTSPQVQHDSSEHNGDFGSGRSVGEIAALCQMVGDSCQPTGERCAVPHERPSSGDSRGSGLRRGARVDGLARVLAVTREADISLLALSAGQVFRFGAVELAVLAPAPGGSRPTPGAEADDANDRSIVLAASTPAGRILLTGDIEAPAQRALLDTGVSLRADVLKLPHHGSRTTTNEFLAAVHPRLTVISVGADNTFGHPNAGILTELSALGTTIARTDQLGDVLVLGEGQSLRVVSAR
ncbi:ComEC/Rec2 family competence protein [Nocardia sp. NPDC056564]|uniref:ComEC/Rec2 family competence protein n=1 Tax=Nocardia sp. NPDC056564 TaxID=3345865 RepID=UPI003670A394